MEEGSETAMHAHRTNDGGFKLQDYEQVLRFRDAVISGSHPRVRLAPHRHSKTLPELNGDGHRRSGDDVSFKVAEKEITWAKQKERNTEAIAVNAQQPAVSSDSVLPGLGIFSQPAAGQSVSNSKAVPGGLASQRALDPIFLEKSENLLRAELLLQRTRLENALRDQVDQQQNPARFALKSFEPLAEFDVDQVLTQAMTLAQANSALPRVNSTGIGPADGSARSDSFDDKTFYSSEDGSPNQADAAEAQGLRPGRAEEDIEEGELEEGSPYEPPLHIDHPSGRLEVLAEVPGTKPYGQVATTAPLEHFVSQLQNDQAASRRFDMLISDSHVVLQKNYEQLAYAPEPELGLLPASSVGGRPVAARRSDSRDTAEASESSDSIYGGEAPPVGPSSQAHAGQSHDLASSAPQGLSVYPPMPAAAESGVDPSYRPAVGTPAQITALRKEASGASSQESSPQSNHAAETKKAKRKNKRKADRMAEDMPYIKPEPKSPSPLAPSQFPRQPKRQRQRRSGRVRTYDDPRFRQAIPLDEDYSDHAQAGPRSFQRQPSTTRNNTSHNGPYTPTSLPVARQERVVEYVREERPGNFVRVSDSQPVPPYYGRDHVTAPGPAAPSPYYPPSDGPQSTPYANRSVDWNGFAAPASHEHLRSPHLTSRPPTDVHPAHPPRPMRVVVDAYGREYIEPPQRGGSFRQSIEPQRLRMEETVEERPMTATPSARIPGTYEERFDPSRASPPSGMLQRPANHFANPGTGYRPYRDHEQLDPPPHYARELVGPTPQFRPQPPASTRRPGEYAPQAGFDLSPMEADRFGPTADYDNRRVLAAQPIYMQARPASVRPAENIRYEDSRRPDTGFLEDPRPIFTRAATVRPMPTPSGAVFNETGYGGHQPVHAFPANGPHYGSMQAPPPPPPFRASSVRPDLGAQYGPNATYTRPSQPNYQGQHPGNQAPVYGGHPPSEYYQ